MCPLQPLRYIYALIRVKMQACTPYEFERPLYAIVQQLVDIQKKSSDCRFHLLLERNVEHSEHVRSSETRVLFSPTVSFDASSPDALSMAEYFVCALRSLSFIATRRKSTKQRYQLVASLASPTLPIPIWFPGKMYTRGNSDNEAV